MWDQFNKQSHAKLIAFAQSVMWAASIALFKRVGIPTVRTHRLKSVIYCLLNLVNTEVSQGLLYHLMESIDCSDHPTSDPFIQLIELTAY
jgi:hypothetical protein